MTDRTTIRLADDLDLMVAPADAGLRLSLLPVREAPAHISATVSTSALLAAIDAADPDAMRAYLRETSPDFVADLLRPADAEGGITAALIEREVPEADSPEDVDEHCRPLTDAQRAAVLKACRDAREALQR